VRQILLDSAQDVCPPGRDDASGFGRLDAARALASVARVPAPAASPTPGPAPTTPPGLPALPTLSALAPAATPQAPPEDQAAPLAAAPSTWYFAEGSTQAPFETWLALFNPNARATDVRVTYMLANGGSLVQQIRMPPDCRHSVRVNDVVPDAELSIRVDSDDTIQAERSMYFGHDGTSSIGASEPSRTWYLAEGSTSPPFDTWVLLQNPNPQPASVQLQFMREDGSSVNQQVALPGSSRRSVYVNQLFQASGFSTSISSDQPIVVERAMYFDGAQGGHGTLAAPEPRHVWYFAEGQTRNGYDTWLLVQDPNDQPTGLKVTFFQEQGPPIVREYDLRARSRFSLYTNDQLPNTAFGMKLEADDSVVAERAVYVAGGRGGFDSVGVPSASREWFLPEGSTRAPFQETLALLNPNSRSNDVTVVLTRGDGAPDESHHLSLAPNSRTTLDVNGLVADADVSAHVTAEYPIVVERTLIFADGTGGTSSPGIPR
jgi:hypothetical protein